MLRRIDGYSGSSILNDELKNLSVPLSATLGLVLFITITVAALLFKDALGIYLKFYLTYFVIGVVTTIVALVAATIVTFLIVRSHTVREMFLKTEFILLQSFQNA